MNIALIIRSIALVQNSCPVTATRILSANPAYTHHSWAFLSYVWLSAIQIHVYLLTYILHDTQPCEAKLASMAWPTERGFALRSGVPRLTAGKWNTLYAKLSLNLPLFTRMQPIDQSRILPANPSSFVDTRDFPIHYTTWPGGETLHGRQFPSFTSFHVFSSAPCTTHTSGDTTIHQLIVRCTLIEWVSPANVRSICVRLGRSSQKGILKTGVRRQMFGLRPYSPTPR